LNPDQVVGPGSIGQLKRVGIEDRHPQAGYPTGSDGDWRKTLVDFSGKRDLSIDSLPRDCKDGNNQNYHEKRHD
jgi:hypothetical protein